MTRSSTKKHLYHKLSQTTNLVYHSEYRILRMANFLDISSYGLHNFYFASNILASESL